MIVDYKSLTGDKFFYLVEQVPGAIFSGNISNFVRERGYFAAYNRAFLEETKKFIHVERVKSRYGDFMGYRKAVRERLFRVFM